MSGSAETSPTSDTSFEQARDELAQVVTALESGGLSLEESLALWQRGEQAADVCMTWLDAARTRLEQAAPAKSTDESAD